MMICDVVMCSPEVHLNNILWNKAGIGNFIFQT